MVKKTFFKMTALLTVTVFGLSACSDPIITATNNGVGEEFYYDDTIVEDGTVSEIDQEYADQCDDWERLEDGSFQCVSEDSDLFGQYLFEGMMFATIGAMVGNALYKKNNHVDGTKYVNNHYYNDSNSKKQQNVNGATSNNSSNANTNNSNNAAADNSGNNSNTSGAPNKSGTTNSNKTNANANANTNSNTSKNNASSVTDSSSQSSTGKVKSSSKSKTTKKSYKSNRKSYSGSTKRR